jgi:hypothetical protein
MLLSVISGVYGFVLVELKNRRQNKINNLYKIRNLIKMRVKIFDFNMFYLIF